MAGHVLKTAEGNTSPYSYVLGARRRQKEAKEDMTKHLQRRSRRDGCQLAWSPSDPPTNRKAPHVCAQLVSV